MFGGPLSRWATGPEWTRQDSNLRRGGSRVVKGHVPSSAWLRVRSEPGRSCTGAWRVKSPLPLLLGDRLSGPQPIRTATSCFQGTGAAKLHQGPGGVSPGSRRRGAREAASAAPLPLVAARGGPHVLEEPAQAAPDPEGPFRPESNHLRFLGSQIGAERVERPPRVLRTRMLPLHHAPPNPRPQNTESLRSHYGKPATGRFGFFAHAVRVMVGGTQEGGSISTCRNGGDRGVVGRNLDALTQSIAVRAGRL